MLDRIAEFFIFGFAPLAVVMLATPDSSLAAERTIKGEVIYRERIALPPDAVLTVQLSDVSLADAPSTTVAKQQVNPAGQVPIHFELKFDGSTIQPRATYALQARITADDRLLFISDQRHEVDPLKTEHATMMLKKVMQPVEQAPESIFDTLWLAEDIEGRGVMDTAQSTMQVKADGSVSGLGACNRYFGSASVNGSDISFSGIGATMMACAPALMDQERKLFEALRKASSFRFEQGKLFLVDAQGRDVARFAGDG